MYQPLARYLTIYRPFCNSDCGATVARRLGWQQAGRKCEAHGQCCRAGIILLGRERSKADN